MDALIEKLNNLNTIKANIRNAIIAKGGAVSDTDTFESYSSKINNIDEATALSDDIIKVLLGINATPTMVMDDTTMTNLGFPLIENIGAGAFYYNKGITSVSLSSVTCVENQAFHDCTSLTTISLPLVTIMNSNSTFCNCSSLTSIDLPLATIIGYEAFRNCTSLVSVSLPSITAINSTAFTGCTALTSISVKGTADSIARAPWGATNATVTWLG